MDQREIQERRRRLNGLLFYFYYLSMKTLAESLFDKDLVQQEITFGTQYVPKGVYVVDDSRFTDVSYDEEDVKWLGTILKVPALKRNIKPYPANEIKTHDDDRFRLVTELGCYIISIIMQFPPLNNNPSYGETVYRQLIQERIVEPYVKKSLKIDYIQFRKELSGNLVFRICTIESRKHGVERYRDRKYFEISFVEK